MTVPAVTRWFTCLASLPQACLVGHAADPPMVTVEVLDLGVTIRMPCPHCTNPDPLLKFLETTSHAEAS